MRKIAAKAASEVKRAWTKEREGESSGGRMPNPSVVRKAMETKEGAKKSENKDKRADGKVMSGNELRRNLFIGEESPP